jgi:hypothetical protein
MSSPHFEAFSHSREKLLLLGAPLLHDPRSVQGTRQSGVFLPTVHFSTFLARSVEEEHRYCDGQLVAYIARKIYLRLSRF